MTFDNIQFFITHPLPWPEAIVFGFFIGCISLLPTRVQQWTFVVVNLAFFIIAGAWYSLIFGIGAGFYFARKAA